MQVAALTGFKCLKRLSPEEIDGPVTLTLFDGDDGAENDTMRAELTSDAGKHYAAVVRLASSCPRPKGGIPDVGPLEQWPGGPYYDGVAAFHTAPFRVIECITGIGPGGITGKLSSGAPERIRELLLVDGGLQTAGLWTWRRLGGATLPMAIGAFRRYAAMPKGPLQCTVKVAKTAGPMVTADLYLHDGDDLIAEMVDLEMVIYHQKSRPVAEEEAADPDRVAE